MKNEPFTIYLNAGLNATLDFQEETKLAIDAIRNGSKLCFEVDLGLFSELKKPLSNQSQYLSLDLSLEHFKNTLWNTFQDDIQEVCLYRGKLDFAKDFIFDETQQVNLQGWIQDRFVDTETFFEETGISISNFSEITSNLLSLLVEGKKLTSLFCRDACLDYIHLLRANLPDTMPISLRLDAKEITDPLFFALLTNKEIYQFLDLFLTNSPMKQLDQLIDGVKPNVAICLSSSKMVRRSECLALSKAFEFLIEMNIPYRLIPESLLITDWDLVDFLLVLSIAFNKEGKRKLQGFAAAGGTVVTLGEMIGIPGEISFMDYTVNNFGS